MATKQGWVEMVEARRVELGMTKTALAEAADIAQGRCSDILNGVRGVHVDTFERMAEAVGLVLVVKSRTKAPIAKRGKAG